MSQSTPPIVELLDRHGSLSTFAVSSHPNGIRWTVTVDAQTKRTTCTCPAQHPGCWHTVELLRRIDGVNRAMGNHPAAAAPRPERHLRLVRRTLVGAVALCTFVTASQAAFAHQHAVRCAMAHTSETRCPQIGTAMVVAR